MLIDKEKIEQERKRTEALLADLIDDLISIVQQQQTGQVDPMLKPAVDLLPLLPPIF